ncbi:hypothetical protein AWB80_01258 [Caballeronia pedi]|uniref:Uncharacterized protein n=1 Tax=Caballeronia pedi TaxID=1777141 RepID=A0A157ZUX7_9BURK|nr:hypothetical protein [Caballeronia pedi]SAK48717.1 hypothetical protein AWB80_01258 [Caballeronia pedi]
MPGIDSYITQVSTLIFETDEGERQASALIEFGGWDYKKKTLTPINVFALSAKPAAPVLTWVLDSLAAAAEARRLDGDKALAQLFANKTDARDFRMILRDAGDVWVNDRHRVALRKCGWFDSDPTWTYPVISGVFTLSERRASSLVIECVSLEFRSRTSLESRLSRPSYARNDGVATVRFFKRPKSRDFPLLFG